jgi:hypothetical protein
MVKLPYIYSIHGSYIWVTIFLGFLCVASLGRTLLLSTRPSLDTWVGKVKLTGNMGTNLDRSAKQRRSQSPRRPLRRREEYQRWKRQDKKQRLYLGFISTGTEVNVVVLICKFKMQIYTLLRQWQLPAVWFLKAKVPYLYWCLSLQVVPHGFPSIFSLCPRLEPEARGSECVTPLSQNNCSFYYLICF